MRQSPPDTPNPGWLFAKRVRQMKTLLAEGIRAGEITIDSPSNEMLARSVIGAAAAKTVHDLGAMVTVMDYAPVEYETDQIIEMDLRDPDSIDRAVDELPGPVDAVFAAAGIADGPDLMRAVFIGHRHLIERLMAKGLLPRGSVICFISSVGGMGWENDLDLHSKTLLGDAPPITTPQISGSSPMTGTE